MSWLPPGAARVQGTKCLRSGLEKGGKLLQIREGKNEDSGTGRESAEAACTFKRKQATSAGDVTYMLTKGLRNLSQEDLFFGQNSEASLGPVTRKKNRNRGKVVPAKRRLFFQTV